MSSRSATEARIRVISEGVVASYLREISAAAAEISTAAPMGSGRTVARMSSGAVASSRSISSRPWRKCLQPS